MNAPVPSPRLPAHPVADQFTARWSPRALSDAPVSEGQMLTLLEQGRARARARCALRDRKRSATSHLEIDTDLHLGGVDKGLEADDPQPLELHGISGSPGQQRLDGGAEGGIVGDAQVVAQPHDRR